MRILRITMIMIGALMLAACAEDIRAHPGVTLVAQGNDTFFNETFDDNLIESQFIIGAKDNGINLETTRMIEAAAYFRVIDALEYIRFTLVLMGDDDLEAAMLETQDAINVLSDGGLHPHAVQFLKDSQILMDKANHNPNDWYVPFREAAYLQAKAHDELVDRPTKW